MDKALNKPPLVPIVLNVSATRTAVFYCTGS